MKNIPNIKNFADAPERDYLRAAQKDFVDNDPGKAAELLKELSGEQDVEVRASQDVVAHVATIGERKYVFLENFAGLKPGEIAVPRTQHDVAIRLHAPNNVHMHILPFLGKESDVPGKQSNGVMEFALPELQRGAVVWFQ